MLLWERSFIKKFHDNDSSVWDKLFNDTYHRLLVYTLRFGIDTKDREDIVANAFKGLFQNRLQIKHEDNIRPYLFKSVKNGCVKHVESRKATTSRLKKLATIIPFQQENEAHQKEASNIIEKIKSMIKKLPLLEKEVLLYFLDDLTAQEIANKLGIDKQTVYTKKSRAIKRLKRLIVSSDLKSDSKYMVLIILLFTRGL